MAPPAERLAHTGSGVKVITEPCVPICTFMCSVKYFTKVPDSVLGLIYNNQIFFWSCIMLTLCFFSCFYRRTENPQEEVSIFQISDPRTRKRIFFQCVHQQRETHATVTDAQPHRPTSEDLVSEPSHEREKAEQRQVTVLHIQPSPLGVKSSATLSLQWDRQCLQTLLGVRCVPRPAAAALRGGSIQV